MNSIDLLDGDIILYQMAFSAAKPVMEHEAEDYNFSTVDRASTAEEGREKTWEEITTMIDEFMINLWKETGSTFYHSYLSPPRAENFRSKVAWSKKYKGNRDNTELPKYFQEIRQYLIDRWKFVQLEVIETDDMLGIMQHHYIKADDTYSTIVSKDKDLKQIVGKHYNWVTNEVTNVSKEASNYLLWMQMLTGDTTDNIIGCGKMEWTYWGAKKKVAESGILKIVKEKRDLATNEFATKAAMMRYIDTLLYEGLQDPGVAQYLKEVYGVEQVKRRVGIGEKEAQQLLAIVKPTQYYAQVQKEYIDRFGYLEGINKFNETFNLVYILRSVEEARFCGLEDIPTSLVESHKWTYIINQEDKKESDDDEF